MKETNPGQDRAVRYGLRRGAKGSTNPYFCPLFCQGTAEHRPAEEDGYFHLSLSGALAGSVGDLGP